MTRGDLMREVLARAHDMFASDPLRDGPFCIKPVLHYDEAFLVQNFGCNRGGSMSAFLAHRSGFYKNPDEWIFEVLR